MPRKLEPHYVDDLQRRVDAIFVRAKEIWPPKREDPYFCWRMLANTSGLTRTTVYRLGYRETRFPEDRTLALLAMAVNQHQVIATFKQRKVRRVVPQRTRRAKSPRETKA